MKIGPHLHTHSVPEDHGVRWFAHLYWRLPSRTEPCWACRDSKHDEPTGREIPIRVRRNEEHGMEEWEQRRRGELGIDDYTCLACAGTKHKLNRECQKKLAAASLEATPNRTHAFTHAEVTLGGRGGEEGLQLALAVPKVFAVWLSFQLPWTPWDWLLVPERMGYDERTVGLKLYGSKLHLMVIAPEGGSTSTPRFTWTKWLRGGRDRRRRHRPDPMSSRWKALDGWEFRLELNPLTLLFGSPKRIAMAPVSEPVRTVVAMPEGNYPATVKLEKWTYARPRWPRWPLRREVVMRGDVDLDVAIPVPGKGENSWDIDDDAIYSSSGPYRTVAAAVASVAESALSKRERYARRDWVPDAGWPAEVSR